MAYRPTAPKQCPYIHPDNPVPLTYYHDSDPPASGEYDPVADFINQLMGVVKNCYDNVEAYDQIGEEDPKTLGYAPSNPAFESIPPLRVTPIKLPFRDIQITSTLKCLTIGDEITETVVKKDFIIPGMWHSLPYQDGSEPSESDRPWYDDSGPLSNYFWSQQEFSENDIDEGIIKITNPTPNKIPTTLWPFIEPSKYDFSDSGRNRKTLPIYNPRDKYTQDFIIEGDKFDQWLVMFPDSYLYDKFIPVDENGELPEYMMNEIRAWYYYNFPEEDSWPELFSRNPDPGPCPGGFLHRSFEITCINIDNSPEEPPPVAKPKIWKGFDGPAA